MRVPYVLERDAVTNRLRIEMLLLPKESPDEELGVANAE